MQGVVDHWCAFALVAVSVLRTPRAWRALLAVNLAAGAVLSLLAIGRSLEMEPSWFAVIQELEHSRLGVTMGNPIMLASYVSVNAVLALGMAARCLAHWRRAGPAIWTRAAVWAGAAMWASVAGLHLAAFVLAGSAGSFAGLAAGLGLAAVAGAFLALRRRRATIAVVAVLCAVPARVAVVDSAVPPGMWPEAVRELPFYKFNPLNPSLQSRLSAWEAGIRGFAERPLLGWGPEHFEPVFGRFARGYGTTMLPLDRAHAAAVQIAATTGAAGLAAWLALWGVSAAALWRAVRLAGREERALLVFIGAAVTVHLVQLQVSFYFVTSWLHQMLLLGFIIRISPPAAPGRWTAGVARAASALLGAGAFQGLRGLLRSGALRGFGVLRDGRALRAGALAGALVLAGSGLASNVAIYGGARALALAVTSQRLPLDVQPSVDAFEPLAGEPRRFLFVHVTQYWETLRQAAPDRASALLAVLDREARAAVAADPLDWRIQHSLARMYAAVAWTEPAYAERAAAELARARVMAPNRRVFGGRPTVPTSLEAHPRPGGGHELRWQGTRGVGYHQLRELKADGRAPTLLYTYDPARTSFVAAAEATATPRRFVIRACMYPGHCSDWAQWSPLPASPGAGEDAAATGRP